MSYRDAVVLALCSETKLPIFSLDTSRYRVLGRKFGVKTIEKELILKYNSPQEIYNKAKIKYETR